MVLSVFSLVDLVFFAPLPYQNNDNLYLLEGTLSAKSFDESVGTNPQVMAHVEKNNDVFSEFATFHQWTEYKLYDQVDRPEVQVILASHNLFNVLGVEPELGRLFNKSEALGTKQSSVILSYRLWQDLYQGDKNIVGKKIQLNQRRFTVIGVTPDNLVLPQYQGINEAMWLPMDMDETFDTKTSGNFMGSYKVVVRLKPNLDLARVSEQINTLSAQGGKLYATHIPSDFILKAKLTTFTKALQGDSGNIVLMLFFGVLLLMVIALINLSSMQLAKAVAKIKTVAISFAFGASNKQLLVESFKHNIFVIGLAVLLALFLTIGCFSLIQSMAEESIQRLDTLAISSNTLFFSTLLALSIALLYSLIELHVVNEKTLIASLQSSGKGVGKQMSAGTSHLLIGLQILLSFMVLIAASHVAVKTLTEALRENGVDTQNKWSLTVNFSNIERKSELGKRVAERQNVQRALVSELKKVSSIVGVEITSEAKIPLGLNTNPLYDAQKNYIASTRKIGISSGYLPALGLIIEGENFKKGDSELENYPVIINQRLADLMGAENRDVLGQKVSADGKSFHPIIGVVANTYVPGSVEFEAHEVYSPKNYSGWRKHSFLITVNNKNLIEQQIQALTSSLDPRLDITRLISLDEQFYEARRRHLTAAWLAIILASVSVLMVIIGINGIVNYMVQVRRYDLGVKLAMGANNSRLLKDSLSELMLPIAISLLFAFSLSFLGLGYSRSQPELTVEANWLLVAGILLGFIVISLLASFFPVRKILTNDPVKALRNE